MTRIIGLPVSPTGGTPATKLVIQESSAYQGGPGRLSPGRYEASWNYSSGKWEVSPGVELNVIMPRLGMNDPIARGTITRHITTDFDNSDKSRTSSKTYAAQVWGETSTGVFDLSIDPEAVAFIPSSSLSSLTAGLETLKTQVDASVATIAPALATIPAGLANIAASKAALELAAGTTPLANETALTGKPAGAYRLLSTNEQVLWSGTAITARSPISALKADLLKRPIPRSFFGMHMDQRLSSNYQTALGYGSLRVWDSGCHWRQIETSPGVYDWTALDAVVAACEAAGIEVMYTLGQAPNWETGGVNTGAPSNSYNPLPPSPASVATFVTAIATRYNNRIRLWETWNEVNLPGFWAGTPAQMVAITAATSAALKAVNPLNVVVAPDVTNDAGGVGSAYLAQLLDAGVDQYVDVYSVHLYFHPYEPETQIRLLRGYVGELQARGIQKPIWNTEITVANFSDDAGATQTTINMPDAQAAAYVQRVTLVNLIAGVDRMFWYDMGLAGNAVNFNKIPLATNTGTLTAAGMAYQGLVTALTGASLISSGASGGVYYAEFQQANGKRIRYEWTNDRASVQRVNTVGEMVAGSLPTRTITRTPTPVSQQNLKTLNPDSGRNVVWQQVMRDTTLTDVAANWLPAGLTVTAGTGGGVLLTPTGQFAQLRQDAVDVVAGDLIRFVLDYDLPVTNSREWIMQIYEKVSGAGIGGGAAVILPSTTGLVRYVMDYVIPTGVPDLRVNLVNVHATTRNPIRVTGFQVLRQITQIEGKLVNLREENLFEKAISLAANATRPVMLRLNTERPWQLVQKGSGSGTSLALQPLTSGKSFYIETTDGTGAFQFEVAATPATSAFRTTGQIQGNLQGIKDTNLRALTLNFDRLFYFNQLGSNATTNMGITPQSDDRAVVITNAALAEVFKFQISSTLLNSRATFSGYLDVVQDITMRGNLVLTVASTATTAAKGPMLKAAALTATAVPSTALTASATYVQAESTAIIARLELERARREDLEVKLRAAGIIT